MLIPVRKTFIQIYAIFESVNGLFVPVQAKLNHKQQLGGAQNFVAK